MAETIIIDSNCSGLKETFFLGGEQNENTTEKAKKMTSILINSLETSSRLNLLKEKIRNSGERGFTNEDEIIILDIYKDISENTEANFNLGLYFLMQNDIEKGVNYFKKSLEKDKKYEALITSFIINIINQVKKGFDIKTNKEKLYFVKEFKEITIETTKNEINTSQITEEKKRLLDFQNFLKTL